MRKFNDFVLAVIVSAALAFTSCAGEKDSERQPALQDETVSVTLNTLSFDFATINPYSIHTLPIG